MIAGLAFKLRLTATHTVPAGQPAGSRVSRLTWAQEQGTAPAPLPRPLRWGRVRVSQPPEMQPPEMRLGWGQVSRHPGMPPGWAWLPLPKARAPG